MLHIVCPNTAIDVRVELDHFRHGSVQRSKVSRGFASGKGVNSAFTCEFLQVSASLYALVGDLDLDYYEAIKTNYIEANFSGVSGETRRNLTIVDGGGFVCHIQNDGYKVSEVQSRDFVTAITQNIASGDVLLISGSLPEGFSSKHISELINLANEKNTKIVLDTELFRLNHFSPLELDYLKPNLEEFFSFMNENSFSSSAQAFSKLDEQGVKNVILSCGDQGAFFFQNTSNDVLHLTSKFDATPNEAIGSGDAFIGAFSAQLSLGKDYLACLNSAIAAGHSNLFHHGPGRLGPTYYDILKSVKVANYERDFGYKQVDHLLLQLK